MSIKKMFLIMWHLSWEQSFKVSLNENFADFTKNLFKTKL